MPQNKHDITINILGTPPNDGIVKITVNYFPNIEQLVQHQNQQGGYVPGNKLGMSEKRKANINDGNAETGDATANSSTVASQSDTPSFAEEVEANAGIPLMSYLREAVKAVPAVRYAVGLIGVVAAFAIIATFNLSWRAGVFGTIGVFAGMTLLLVFAHATRGMGRLLRYPAIAMVYFVTFIFMTIVSLIVSCTFFDKPKPIQLVFRENLPEAFGTFLKVGTAETLPALLSPPNGEQFSGFPRNMTFEWSPFRGAERYILEVEIQDDSGGFFPHPIKARVPTTLTRVDYEFMGDQPGRWRVVSIGVDGATTTSNWWEFFWNIDSVDQRHEKRKGMYDGSDTAVDPSRK